MIEKKPCPFCGSINLDYQTFTQDREGIPTNIVCEDCGSRGPWIYLNESEIERDPYVKVENEWVRSLPKRALELWNKRK